MSPFESRIVLSATAVALFFGAGGCRDRGATALDASTSQVEADTSDADLDRDVAERDASPERDAELPQIEVIEPEAPVVDLTPPPTSLYPPIRPRRTGRLRVSKVHELYWELVGSPGGIKVMVLHGGPGGRAGPFLRRFFDPSRFDVVLYDQRGAGRSRPKAEWRENTTALLIEDIEALRSHLGFDEPVILSGGSWGSTLAVAYAEAYPEKVAGIAIRGVFLCSKAEIDHFYHGGTAVAFPENYAALQAVVPHPERLDYPRQLFEMITTGSREERRRAISGWARYEMRMVSVDMTAERAERMSTRGDWSAFSTLENHYMMQGCFLEEGQLLRDAERIAHIPTAIVSGGRDVLCPPRTAEALAARLRRVRLEIVPEGAHSSRDAPIGEAFLRAVDWVADQALTP